PVAGNQECPHFRPPPPQMSPSALDARAPSGEQCRIGIDTRDVQHGAGRIEEQVTAGEAPRMIERQ
ncbi:MAG TPA: hypothetical protein VGA44_07740, partial [Steroidobacteraceae bacterium]